MSIILEGIDLPKGEGTEVIIRIQPNGEVRDSHGILLTVKAIQIPKNHGKIVDVNDLKADMRFYESKYCEEQGYITEDDINCVPTILESEETDEFNIERD